MSRDDFSRCTPAEFAVIYEKWNERETRLYRDGWEQTRLLYGAITRFYSKKDVGELLPFPWDDEREGAPTPQKGTSSAERMKEVAARLTRK